MVVVWLFLVVSWVCVHFVVVVFPRSYSLTFSEYMHAKNKEFCTFFTFFYHYWKYLLLRFLEVNILLDSMVLNQRSKLDVSIR